MLYFMAALIYQSEENAQKGCVMKCFNAAMLSKDNYLLALASNLDSFDMPYLCDLMGI